MTVQDQATHPEVADLGDFTAAWQGWHAGQEARLADPHAFLAITSLHWLTETPQRFGDAAGAWHTGPDGVTVELADGEELVIGGAAVRGRYSFGVIPELGGVNAGWGDAVIEVAKRGGHDIVRRPSGCHTATPTCPARNEDGFGAQLSTEPWQYRRSGGPAISSPCGRPAY